ncbi:MAG: cyclase family protein [Candidatus Doudnabacteria bacterium]
MSRFVELGHILEQNPPRLEAQGHVATCLHAPFHRFEDGDDLSRIPLGAVAGIPGVVVDAAAQTGAVTLKLDRKTIKDKAVIIRTGWDERWGTARYWQPGPYLHIEVLDLLVGGGAVLVGVDFWNVDDTADLASQARTRLLRAGVLVVEHLCNLRGLPREGFRFFAVPLRIAGGASVPVRAFAELGSGNGVTWQAAGHVASTT